MKRLGSLSNYLTIPRHARRNRKSISLEADGRVNDEGFKIYKGTLHFYVFYFPI